MHNSGRSFRYALAIFAAFVALMLRSLLTPLLGNGNPYHTVWLAVVFSAWYCGVGPSIVTTVLRRWAYRICFCLQFIPLQSRIEPSCMECLAS